MPKSSVTDNESVATNAELERSATRSLLLALIIPVVFALAAVVTLLFVVEATVLMWLTVPFAAFFIGTFAAMSLILFPSAKKLSSMVNGANHPEAVGKSLAEAMGSSNLAHGRPAMKPHRHLAHQTQSQEPVSEFANNTTRGAKESR